MSFRHLFAWIKYKRLPNVFQTRNRLLLEKNEKRANIFSNLGQTFRSEKWSLFSTNNLLSNYKNLLRTAAYFLSFLFILVFISINWKTFYIFTTDLNLVSWIAWSIGESWNYLTSFLVLGTVILRALLLDIFLLSVSTLFQQQFYLVALREETLRASPFIQKFSNVNRNTSSYPLPKFSSSFQPHFSNSFTLSSDSKLLGLPWIVSIYKLSLFSFDKKMSFQNLFENYLLVYQIYPLNVWKMFNVNYISPVQALSTYSHSNLLHDRHTFTTLLASVKIKPTIYNIYPVSQKIVLFPNHQKFFYTNLYNLTREDRWLRRSSIVNPSSLSSFIKLSEVLNNLKQEMGLPHDKKIIWLNSWNYKFTQEQLSQIPYFQFKLNGDKNLFHKISSSLSWLVKRDQGGDITRMVANTQWLQYSNTTPPFISTSFPRISKVGLTNFFSKTKLYYPTEKTKILPHNNAIFEVFQFPLWFMKNIVSLKKLTNSTTLNFTSPSSKSQTQRIRFTRKKN